MKNKHNGAENDNPTTVSDVKTPEFVDVTSVHQACSPYWKRSIAWRIYLQIVFLGIHYKTMKKLFTIIAQYVMYILFRI